MVAEIIEIKSRTKLIRREKFSIFDRGQSEIRSTFNEIKVFFRSSFSLSDHSMRQKCTRIVQERQVQIPIEMATLYGVISIVLKDAFTFK